MRQIQSETLNKFVSHSHAANFPLLPWKPFPPATLSPPRLFSKKNPSISNSMLVLKYYLHALNVAKICAVKKKKKGGPFLAKYNPTSIINCVQPGQYFGHDATRYPGHASARVLGELLNGISAPPHSITPSVPVRFASVNITFWPTLPPCAPSLLWFFTLWIKLL